MCLARFASEKYRRVDGGRLIPLLLVYRINNPEFFAIKRAGAIAKLVWRQRKLTQTLKRETATVLVKGCGANFAVGLRFIEDIFCIDNLEKERVGR
jgi:hypothetical protein